MLRQYIEREDDQQTTDVQVCSVAVLDCTSKDTEDNIEGLVESPSICDSESIEMLNINPDLTKEQQSGKATCNKFCQYIYRNTRLCWNMT